MLNLNRHKKPLYRSSRAEEEEDEEEECGNWSLVTDNSYMNCCTYCPANCLCHCKLGGIYNTTVSSLLNV